MTDTQDGERLADQLLNGKIHSLSAATNFNWNADARSIVRCLLIEAIQATLALRTPPAREREAIARIIDPDEWLFFDNANAVTKMQKPVSLWRIEPSLAKADAILALSATPASPMTATDGEAG